MTALEIVGMLRTLRHLLCRPRRRPAYTALRGLAAEMVVAGCDDDLAQALRADGYGCTIMITRLGDDPGAG